MAFVPKHKQLNYYLQRNWIKFVFMNDDIVEWKEEVAMVSVTIM